MDLQEKSVAKSAIFNCDLQFHYGVLVCAFDFLDRKIAISNICALTSSLPNRFGLHWPPFHLRSRPPGIRLPPNCRRTQRGRTRRIKVCSHKFSSHSIANRRVLHCSIGTTKKGIGPAYSAKASRSGLRVHHLFDHETFTAKFRKVVEGRYKRYGHFDYDTEGEIVRYKVRIFRLLFIPHIQLLTDILSVHRPLQSASSPTSSTASHSSTKPSPPAKRSSSKAPTPSCSTSTSAPTPSSHRRRLR